MDAIQTAHQALLAAKAIAFFNKFRNLMQRVT
jgi:hypothetical protein